VVLPDLQGKGHERSLSAESLFGYFCGDKNNWPSRGQERVCAKQRELLSLKDKTQGL